MVDGTFVQIAPVALPIAQGTARGTVVTAVYALAGRAKSTMPVLSETLIRARRIFRKPSSWLSLILLSVKRSNMP